MKRNFLRFLSLVFLLGITSLAVKAQDVHRIENTVADTLMNFINDTEAWSAGDIVLLSSDSFSVSGTINIPADLTIMGDPALVSRPTVYFQENGFNVTDDSVNVKIQGINFVGNPEGVYAPFILRYTGGDTEGHYDYVVLKDVDATGFRGGIDLNPSKQRYYEMVEIDNCYFTDFTGQEWILDPNLNVVKSLKITNSTFSEVGAVLKNVYFNKDGSEVFGDVIQTIVVDHNTFFRIGDNNNSLIQLNDQNDGNLDFTFSNNVVSGLLNSENARPFRLNASAGLYKFINSHFHDFVPNPADKDHWTLDSIAINPAYDLAVSLENVTLSGDYPGFKDTTTAASPKSFILPAESPLLTASTEEGPIGDPRWFASQRSVALDLEAFIENTSLWSAGDTIVLTQPEYVVTNSIDVWQSVVIKGDPTLPQRPVIKFTDNGFSVKDDSINVAITGVDFVGNPEGSYASFILRYGGGSAEGHYDYAILKDVDATGFRGGIDLNPSKQRYYSLVEIDNCYFSDFTGQEWVIDPNLNVVKELRITNSTFSEVGAVLKNVYFNKDGGEVFGDVVQEIVVDHNTFFRIGDNNNSLIQLNDQNDGNLDFTFSNNVVSGLLNPENSRPFRLNTAAGAYKFKNSHFHDFVPNPADKDHWTLDSIVINPAYDLAVTLENVTLSGDYPEFKDTTMEASPKNFSLPAGSSLLTAATDGGPIGDPRWNATVKKVTANLEAFIEDTTLWSAGDTILLSNSHYTVNGSIDILQSVVIMGDPSLSDNPIVTFTDNGFHVKDDTINIAIVGVDFVGKTLNDNLQDRYAAFILRYSGGDAEGRYDYAILKDVNATGFKGGIDLNPSKQRWYGEVTLDNVFFHDFTGQEWVIDPNINVVKELNIINSTFSEVGAVLKNVYFNKDGGEIFGDVIQEIVVDHNTFYKIGDNNNSLIQLNDQNDGNLDFTFSNNIVSSLLNPENARPFRLNTAAGSYKFLNSYFHDFIPNPADKDHWTLDSISVNPAYDAVVSLTDVSLNAEDPEFADVPWDFTIDATSPAYLADGKGGYIGDPQWLPNLPGLSGERIHPIPNTVDSLEHFIELHMDMWDPGDTILLVSSGTYDVTSGLELYQGLTILGDPTLSLRPEIRFYDDGMNIQGDSMSVIFSGVRLNGLHENGIDRAGYLLNSSSGGLGAQDSIIFDNVDVKNFNFGIELYRGGDVTYDLIEINDSYFENISNWILDPRTNGAVAQTTITNSTFVNISNFLKNYYNNNNGTDGDLGDVAMNITIDHNTFYKVYDILIQTNDSRDGQLNMTFSNNIVSTLTRNDVDGSARPFRIEHNEAGSFVFESNVFHDFDSPRESGGSVSGYNIDSLAELSNVTLTNFTKVDPGFISPDDEPYNFSYSLDSELNSYATDGGQMGDPRWYPSIGVSIVPLEDAVTALTTQQMQANVTFGSSVTDLTVTWSVINGTGTATIDASGLLSAATAGTVWVKAVSNHNSLYADSVEVTIVPPTFVTAISLRSQSQLGTETQIISQPGGSLQVLATVLPGSATDRSITWSIDNDEIASMQSLNPTSILLTAKGTGVVTVIATAVDGSGVTGEIEITLTNQNKVESVTVSGESSIEIGGTTQLTAAVLPANADEDSVSWTSSNASVATVDENGLVTGIAAGKATITARATDGSFKAGTLEITVSAALGLNPAHDLASVYPNPASDFIQLNIDRLSDIEVLNLSGQVVLRTQISNNAKIDITSFENGLYILQVIQGDEIQKIKFVKE